MLPAPAAGSHVALVQMWWASSPNCGLWNRVRLLPEPEKNMTRPVGRTAQCTASTSEWKGRSSHAPWVAIGGDHLAWRQRLSSGAVHPLSLHAVGGSRVGWPGRVTP